MEAVAKTEWDSEQWRRERDAQLLEWFDGDASAVDCYVRISHVAEVWDDLFDGGEVTDKEIEHAFSNAMIGLNFNEFYSAHRMLIVPMLVVILNAWLDSNEMQQSSKKDERVRAYVLRNLGLELVPLFAYLLSGYERMREVSLQARRFFSHETFEDWESEHVTTQL